MTGYNGLTGGAPEKDVLGIATAAREKREKYAKHIERRIDRAVAAALSGPAMQAKIVHEVNERVKLEVDAIVGRLAAEKVREIEQIIRPSGPLVADILAVVVALTGVSLDEIKGQRRHRSIARPRQLAYYLLRTLRTDLSLPKIGHILGGRDHTTCISGLKVVDRLKTEEPFVSWLAHPAIVELRGAP